MLACYIADGRDAAARVKDKGKGKPATAGLPAALQRFMAARAGGA